MSRLSKRFESLKARGEKALIAYVTAGDPMPDRSAKDILAIAAAGADAIEIGVPFSDPLADGPSIQASSQRALEAGMTTGKVLEIVREVRAENSEVPLILMTYFNPILHYGLDKWAQDAKAAGVDAHIVTDLTPEEADEWKFCSEKYGLDTVFLLAPTSTLARIEVVTKLATGFVYCVSRTGVTGAKQDVPLELTEVVQRIQSRTPLPVCVGFGISLPEHVKKICTFADGAVVGSALVDLLYKHRASEDPSLTISQFISELKAATK